MRLAEDEHADLDAQATQALAELHAAAEPETAFSNEGAADYACSCCDEPVRVPRGATVIHNGERLHYGAFDGLTVDGEPVSQA